MDAKKVLHLVCHRGFSGEAESDFDKSFAPTSKMLNRDFACCTLDIMNFTKSVVIHQNLIFNRGTEQKETLKGRE